MNKFSEQAKKKKKIYKQNIRVNPDMRKFCIWLTVEKGVNVSEFTRLLWANSPEHDEFTESLQKEKNESNNDDL